MLTRHAFAYLLSHGVPAIVGFIGIAIYSRLLTPAEYGRYALLFAVAALLNAIVFEWLKVSVLRLQKNGVSEDVFYMTVKATFLILMCITFILAGIIWIISDHIAGVLLLLALFLSWGQSWYQLNLSLLRAELNPLGYGKVAFVRAVLGLGLASLFILLGYAEVGLVIGLLFGLILSVMPLLIKRWGFKVKPSIVSIPLLKEYASYGLPLTITLLLGMIIHQSDRFIISAMMGVESTGAYAVTYDLTEQSIFTMMLIVNLAAFPLAVKRLESQGEQAAYKQVKTNTSMLLMIGTPVLIGFMMARESIAYLFLGEAFRETAVELIPFIAVGALLKGFKLYGIDILFHLKKQTKMQIIPVIVAACANVGLTIWLIPSYGLQGAALATVIAYALAIASSWLIIRLQQPIFPFPYKVFVKILCSGAAMFIALSPFSNQSSFLTLLLQLIIGLLSYTLVLSLLHIRQIRLFFQRRLEQKQTL